MEHSRKPQASADGRDHRDALVVHARKGKTVLATLCFVAFTVALVVIVGVLGPQEWGIFYGNPTVVVLAQIGGGLLGGIPTIRLLTILFSAAPRVVVRHEGIRVTSLLFGSAIIPWAEIESLLVWGIGSREWPP